MLNDFSGSPKVLRQVILEAKKVNAKLVLNTSNYQSGFLSNIGEIEVQNNSYRFYENKLLRLIAFIFSQFRVFFKALFTFQKSDVVYINTLLPFGASIAAKIKGSSVIYHIHESSIKPRLLMWFLVKLAYLTATEIIYVSNYVKNELGIKHKNERVIYNSIDKEFLTHIKEYSKNEEQKNVLMVCSLKLYKGVNEFVCLSKSLPEHNFELVLNASQDEVEKFINQQEIPSNMKCFSKQDNLHPFYQRADVVLNLSHPDLWVETFGLTVLEAMFYGRPTIVPPVGGVKEIVLDNESAYCISVKNLALVKAKLKTLLSNTDLYSSFAEQAKFKAQEFLPEKFDLAIAERLENYSKK